MTRVKPKVSGIEWIMQKPKGIVSGKGTVITQVLGSSEQHAVRNPVDMLLVRLTEMAGRSTPAEKPRATTSPLE